MKFTWFHLMPYRWLPEDFRERYHSVWVDVPNRLYDPERGHALYNEYLDMLEYADQSGFDAIAVNEHHQNAYGMMPSPNLMAAALSRRATRANIMVLGNSLALEELAKSLRVGHLLLGCHIGSAPIEIVNNATRLAGQEILPYLRPLYSEWQDHWSPKPLEASRRVAPGANASLDAAEARP